MRVSKTYVAYIFSDQRVTNYVHVTLYHFYTPFRQQNVLQCKPEFWFKHILFDQSLLHRYNIIEVGSDGKP